MRDKWSLYAPIVPTSGESRKKPNIGRETYSYPESSCAFLATKKVTELHRCRCLPVWLGSAASSLALCRLEPRRHPGDGRKFLACIWPRAYRPELYIARAAASFRVRPAVTDRQPG